MMCGNIFEVGPTQTFHPLVLFMLFQTEEGCWNPFLLSYFNLSFMFLV
ncbi:hypothetical protein MtrunA17_Chr1g0157111 [Medicago truncatula]|uniref:Uncharacterized protein n=1 Tax=Medicago truncatula TaxID=3880 RepID=A0A396JHE8_MEDTR|nr:hypothetical protein MtrunA17_Chr1g0157111 [Medicago truncatula]